MITIPIYSLAQLTNPTWGIQSTGWVKTSWTDFPNTTQSQIINASDWQNNVALYYFIDGYRSINIQGLTTKYINPINGTSLLNSHSDVHYSVFTSKLDIPMGNGYTNYLATGLFIDDKLWERCDNDYASDGIATEECWKTKIYKYGVTSGKSFVTEKHIVFSCLQRQTASAPEYPYTSTRWFLKDII